MSKVFISYVRDDQNAVNLLAAELRREGIHVWLDRDDIRPGEFWEETLQDAIRNGAYFLACFSAAFHSRESTYMYEELRIACMLSNTGNRNTGWLIPILLSPCEIPNLPVSENRTLRDLQWLDLSQDWNTGIWTLLQLVRPNSIHSRAIDDWFRQLCTIQIKSVQNRAWSLGAFRVRQIEDGWTSLLLPSRWNPTLDIIVRLFDKVKERKIPLTERWIEPANTGITIVTTISPTASVDTIIRSLSTVNAETTNPYDAFISHERKLLRNLANWPDRDWAHWIFALDGDDITVDLLYWPNLRLMLTVLGMMFEQQKKGEPVGSMEIAYPGSLQTVTEFENIQNAIYQEEVLLYKQSPYCKWS